MGTAVIPKISKEMNIADILNVNPNIANILMGMGMHCIFCGAAAGESLEEACYVHGIPSDGVDMLVEQINDFLSSGGEF